MTNNGYCPVNNASGCKLGSEGGRGGGGVQTTGMHDDLTDAAVTK